ncbi:hypothetical protein AAFF_G00097170 [Aldrovandia affinis]|uniref:UPAR/Ly6 domain-containing protein n=1 Tax=Aldrovandia affinis TaxID=143900 RepID=A0AAD7RVE2_9TELE|nr:hypothetical protein AAFF_G00097170 [Aldrovandia affinis]
MYRAVCVVLCACLLLPALRCENLLCYHCHPQPNGEVCRPVLSECRPQEVCVTATGRNGGRVVLSVRACLAKHECRLEHVISYKGTNITVSYSCCDWNYCNSGSRITVHSALFALAVATTIILPAWAS